MPYVPVSAPNKSMALLMFSCAEAASGMKANVTTASVLIAFFIIKSFLIEFFHFSETDSIVLSATTHKGAYGRTTSKDFLVSHFSYVGGIKHVDGFYDVQQILLFQFHLLHLYFCQLPCHIVDGIYIYFWLGFSRQHLGRSWLIAVFIGGTSFWLHFVLTFFHGFQRVDRSFQRVGSNRLCNGLGESGGGMRPFFLGACQTEGNNKQDGNRCSNSQQATP